MLHIHSTYLIAIIAIGFLLSRPTFAEATPPISEELRNQLTNGLLPAPDLDNAWGGNKPNKWQPEAILANAASEAINNAWKDHKVRDVLVAIPITFKPVVINDIPFKPYGDGQTNAEVLLGGWTGSRPPLVAVLKIFDNNRHRVEFIFDKAWNLEQNQIEIAFKPHDKPNQKFKHITLDGKKIDGSLVVQWNEVPDSLNWSYPGQLTSVFVRPSPNFTNWFQIYFRLPRHPVDKFVASIQNPDLRKFPLDNKPILDPEKLRDDGVGAKPMDKALIHKWPSYRYNVDNLDEFGNPLPYIPTNVHAQVGQHGRFTAVGKGYTWVAEKNTNFKAMYTGFDERNPKREAQIGVPSGSGWHVMGDVLTLINYHERVPLLVGAGFTDPGSRFGIHPPNDTYSYGLSDVAVFRLLFPGEAFVTVPTLFPDRDQDLQWYAIHTPHKFLAEEWVHPKRPIGDNPAFE